MGWNGRSGAAEWGWQSGGGDGALNGGTVEGEYWWMWDDCEMEMREMSGTKTGSR